MRSMVEGASPGTALVPAPSTALRAVPLPRLRRGRIGECALSINHFTAPAVIPWISLSEKNA
jgi:hypothetical protein